jgi:Ca2+:H+ antiporter
LAGEDAHVQYRPRLRVGHHRLIVPAALAISGITGRHIILGLGPVELTLLLATFFPSVLVFAGNRTDMLAGAVHLVLFAAYAVLIFD